MWQLTRQMRVANVACVRSIMGRGVKHLKQKWQAWQRFALMRRLQVEILNRQFLIKLANVK
jgi:hypothetical protein